MHFNLAILTVLSRTRSFIRNYVIPSFKGPQVIAIEMTNNCDANCIMCGHGSQKRAKAYMDMQLFKAIVDDAKKNGIKTIQLSFYGEPLLHHHLAEAVAHIRTTIPDSTIVINTNAYPLNKEKASELIDAGISLFSISIDGNNKEEYEKIRLGLKWDVVRKNVADLRALIEEKNSSTQIHIRGLHLKDYPIDIEQYNKNWGEYGNRVVVRNDHELNLELREPLWHKVLPCNKILTQMIFMVDGAVTICAYDWDGEMTYGRFPESSIKELWNAPSLKKNRWLHLFGMKKSMSLCKGCSYRIAAAISS